MTWIATVPPQESMVRESAAQSSDSKIMIASP